MAINDRGGALLAYTIVFMIIPAVAIGLRFWSRAISPSERGRRYWWDDWAALSSMVRGLRSAKFVSTHGPEAFHTDNSFPCHPYDFSRSGKAYPGYSTKQRDKAIESSIRLRNHLRHQHLVAQDIRAFVLRSGLYNAGEGIQIRTLVHSLPCDRLASFYRTVYVLTLRSGREAMEANYSRLLPSEHRSMAS